jgi:hypothetical protein
MARCSCGNAACSCVIKGTPDGGVLVTGSGSPERPYLLELTSGGTPLNSLEMVDSATVKWVKSGAGVPADHRRYTANTDVSMREITDVSKTDVPVTGDVVQWNGTEWVFAAPGATSVPVSGIFGTAPLNIHGANSLIGPSIYLDSNGQIRTAPRVIPSGTFAPTVPITSYPLGVSVMSLFTAANGSTWPFGVSATVTTHHRYEGGPTDDVGYQVWSRNSTSQPQLLVRTCTAGVWSGWTWVGGQAPHYAAYKTAAQAMAVANTWYTATFESAEANEGGITYASGVFTVPVAGKYEINFGTHIQGTTATSTVTLALMKAGVSVADHSYGLMGGNKTYLLSRTLKCAAAEQLYVRSRVTTAGCNMYGVAGSRYTYIDITLVGG